MQSRGPAPDKVGVTDIATAELSTEVVPPRYPCPMCKGETSRSQTQGLRHCKTCDYDHADIEGLMKLHEEVAGLTTQLEKAQQAKKDAVQMMRDHERQTRVAKGHVSQLTQQVNDLTAEIAKYGKVKAAVKAFTAQAEKLMASDE